jgi:hypothetical protein
MTEEKHVPADVSRPGHLQRTDRPGSLRPIGDTGFDVAGEMKSRLGILGRVSISFEERRIARDEAKQVLKNALKAQTEELLNRGRLQLSVAKERDYAAYLQIITEIEKFLMSHQAETQHTLNELIDRFEDAYTDQYMRNSRKLEAEVAGGKIPQDIFDDRLKRARSRYNEAMDKCMNDMQLIVDKHKMNMENALRTIPEK